MPLHVHRLSEAFMIPCLFPGDQAAAEKQSGVDQPISGMNGIHYTLLALCLILNLKASGIFTPLLSVMVSI